MIERSAEHHQQRASRRLAAAPPTQADVDRLMAAAVRSLARDGITPQHVLSWDATGTDRATRALATALGGYLGRSAIQGSPEWWEMLAYRASSGDWPEGSMPS